jgi:hypothetical protein
MVRLKVNDEMRYTLELGERERLRGRCKSVGGEEYLG